MQAKSQHKNDLKIGLPEFFCMQDFEIVGFLKQSIFRIDNLKNLSIQNTNWEQNKMMIRCSVSEYLLSFILVSNGLDKNLSATPIAEDIDTVSCGKPKCCKPLCGSNVTRSPCFRRISAYSTIGSMLSWGRCGDWLGTLKTSRQWMTTGG